MLEVHDYRKSINLDIPFFHTPQTNQFNSIDVILEFLTQRDFNLKAGEVNKRHLLQSLLTTRPPEPRIQEHIHSLIDSLLLDELRQKSIADTTQFTKSQYCIGTTKVALWKGDITTLKVDAIVNAANSQMLGCFIPFHRCIDNAIHCAAGPRLREDCNTIITLQGEKEETGGAKMTRAYNLPSKFVIHTVGPIVKNKIPTVNDEDVLGKSYRSCLQLSKDSSLVKSIAFCSISTGVFGYPINEAAKTALDTVAEWLVKNTGVIDLVIFNVFSDGDESVYKTLLDKWAQIP